MTVYNLISFCGIFLLMAIAWLLSEKRTVINWRVILWGVGIQLIFAVFIFIMPVGSKIFLFLNKVVLKVNEAGEASVGYILAFQALPTIIFFSALVGALYYLRVFPLLIRGFAHFWPQLWPAL